MANHVNSKQPWRSEDEEMSTEAPSSTVTEIVNIVVDVINPTDRVRHSLPITSSDNINSESLLHSIAEEHKAILSKIRNRMDRVAMKPERIEVCFQNLTVKADAVVGERALPSLKNFCLDIIESFLRWTIGVTPEWMSSRRTISILDNVSGLLQPCRMALLLGPPGSGKSVFLQALAGRLHPLLEKSGRVSYNGNAVEEMVPQRTSGYVSQEDEQLADLTVRETLDFSARCQGVGSRRQMLAELMGREREAGISPDPEIDTFMKQQAEFGSDQQKTSSAVTDYVMKILGLHGCADTFVGSSSKRALSGGQKRRLTIGETLVGPQSVLLMDEITNGLDSSTAHQIMRCLQAMAHSLDKTILVSLLQPAPEVFHLFDDVILLSEGRIVYQGPRESVLDFFGRLGFTCPPTKAIPDFLQEVTLRKEQERYWGRRNGARGSYRFISPAEFSEAFEFHAANYLHKNNNNNNKHGDDDDKGMGSEGASASAASNSPWPKAQQYDVEEAEDRPVDMVLDIVHKNSKKKNRYPKKNKYNYNYGASRDQLLRACFWRETLLFRRQSFIYLFKVSQGTMIAIFLMTIFFRTVIHPDNAADGKLYLGALFFLVANFMFYANIESSMIIDRLRIFYKQRDQMLYPAWVYAIPIFITRIPISLSKALTWILVSYYGIGFAPEPSRFFAQILLAVLISQAGYGLFRVTAATARTLLKANTYNAIVFMTMLVLGGYVLSRDKIPRWWLWCFWMSPLMYAQNAITINEFSAPRWNIVPDLDGHTTSSNSPNTTIAQDVLQQYGLFQEHRWIWIGAGALIGFILIFNALFVLAMARLHPISRRQPVTSSASLNKQRSASSSSCNNSTAAPSLNLPHTKTYNGMKESRETMIMPFQPLHVSFENINYYLDSPGKGHRTDNERLQLLKDVSGVLRPGIMTAIIGVTGAGKTTLLDVLAGRKTRGHIEGSIKISGYDKNQDTFNRVAAYCEQIDIHSPNINVREAVLYSAWLRLPKTITKDRRNMFVDEVLKLVELDTIPHALVGFPGVNGLSMEQRKRLTIAVELVANPSIIFMDEPTSGLDGRAASIIMNAVRKVASTGRTVACTIHQPSITIFGAFDELLLMKPGGQIIYAGHVGKDLIQYFESIPNIPKMEQGYNPATWILEITSANVEDRLGIDFAKIYQSSSLFKANQATIQQLSVPPIGAKDLYFRSKYVQNFWGQVSACLWKQNRTYWQNPDYNGIKIMFSTVIALILGTIFWNLGSNISSEQDIRNSIGVTYAATIFIGTTNAYRIIPIINTERMVAFRDKSAGICSTISYAIAQALIEIPYTILQALLYSSILFSMMHFPFTAEKFLWFFFFMFSTFLIYTYFGMMMASLTPDTAYASLTAGTIFASWNITAGFLIPMQRIPVWWRWHYWLNPMAWTLNGIATSQLGDLHATMVETGQGRESVADATQRYFGYRHSLLGVAATAELGFVMLCALIFAISVNSLNFQKR